ncbi:glycosyltransferase family A protein [Altererythrobacter sp. ZODW24]|uniref:glycosyltransferase family 2 protein n=1 Tax=Altererythrobacter sp. ZODW24 TaxID=2185142 RepID=UPI000DF7F711|nr:glycosyltransferase family A protein [Altererythrobacter sp. ZODW24]
MITFVIPYFNEQDYLGETLASLAAQGDRRFDLILVDNKSTDRSAEIAREAAAAMPDIQVQFLSEDRAGKLFALRSGIAAVGTELLGTMDADTIYPPDYVGKTLALFAASPKCSGVMAFNALGETVSVSKWLQVRVRPDHCHTGGYAQNFRTAAIKAVGQYDPAIWPYVLEDHEILHRVLEHGPVIYAKDHVCRTSDRRDDRTDVSWTLSERILYKLLPQSRMKWFFHQFLARRFEARGLSNIRLREQQWQSDQSPE